MLSKLLLSGAILLFLPACSVLRTPALPVVTKVLPPEELLANCEKDSTPALTNGDLARRDRKRGEQLDACTADKAALRKWREAQ